MSPDGSRPTVLVDFREDELPEIARFIAQQAGQEGTETHSRLTWMLVANPARSEGVPIGCGARLTTGELVGCILYLPQVFQGAGKVQLVLGSTCFYVDERHRGAGGPLFLKFSRAAARRPLFGNSANAAAAQLWKARGASPVADSDHELLGVVHSSPIAEEVAVRRGIPPKLARVASLAGGIFDFARKLRLRPSQNAKLSRLVSAEDAAKAILHVAPEHVTALRDQRYMNWRYFSGNDSTVALFTLQSGDSMQQYFVAVNQRPRGHRGQIRSLHLLDVYPKPTPPVLQSLVSSLHELYCSDVDLIVLRGLGAECQEILVSAGFRRRAFEFPNGWFLDKSQFLSNANCYFVPADGDWII